MKRVMTKRQNGQGQLETKFTVHSSQLLCCDNNHSDFYRYRNIDIDVSCLMSHVSCLSSFLSPLSSLLSLRRPSEPALRGPFGPALRVLGAPPNLPPNHPPNHPPNLPPNLPPNHPSNHPPNHPPNLWALWANL